MKRRQCAARARGNTKKSAHLVGAAGRCGAVVVAIRTLNQRTRRRRSVARAGEAIERVQRSAGGELIDGAIPGGAAAGRRAVDVAVAALDGGVRREAIRRDAQLGENGKSYYRARRPLESPSKQAEQQANRQNPFVHNERKVPPTICPRPDRGTYKASGLK